MKRRDEKDEPSAQSMAFSGAHEPMEPEEEDRQEFVDGLRLWRNAIWQASSLNPCDSPAEAGRRALCSTSDDRGAVCTCV
jgi:hypothetical protein